MAKSASADAAPQTSDEVNHDPGSARPLAAPDQAAEDEAGDGAPPSDAEKSDPAEVEGAPTSGADYEPEAPALPLDQAPTSAQAHPSNLAEVWAQLRLEAAEIADIAAQASRLCVAVDAAKALREGTLCPPVVPYSRAEQAQVAGELATLPDGALIADWLADYAVMRDQARACR